MSTTAPASLRRWRPRSWTREEEVFETFDTTAASTNAPILVELEDFPENRDLVTLHRAADHNGLADQLFHPAPITETTRWHDGLERIVSMRIRCGLRSGNETVMLECPRRNNDSPTKRNPANHAAARDVTVVVVLQRGRDGDTTRTLELKTDFAVIDEYDDNPATAGVVVTTESKMGIEELATLIHDALFEPGGDEDDDSFETQLEDSRENAYHAACDLLLDETTARNERIRYTMQHRVGHLVPDGHSVRLQKHPGVETVEVTVSNDEQR